MILMYNESQRLSKIQWSFYVLLVLSDSSGSPLNTIQLSVDMSVQVHSQTSRL